eukprot:6104268-Amphidinium_carterae.1
MGTKRFPSNHLQGSAIAMPDGLMIPPILHIFGNSSMGVGLDRGQEIGLSSCQPRSHSKGSLIDLGPFLYFQRCAGLSAHPKPHGLAKLIESASLPTRCTDHPADDRIRSCLPSARTRLAVCAMGSPWAQRTNGSARTSHSAS